jgi:hypothetical protein
MINITNIKFIGRCFLLSSMSRTFPHIIASSSKEMLTIQYTFNIQYKHQHRKHNSNVTIIPSYSTKSFQPSSQQLFQGLKMRYLLFQMATCWKLTCHHLALQGKPDNGRWVRMPPLQHCCDVESIYNTLLAGGSPKQ